MDFVSKMLAKDKSVSKRVSTCLNLYVHDDIWTLVNFIYWSILIYGLVFQGLYGAFRVALSQILPVIFKFCFQRNRPENDLTTRVIWDKYSFPSGHAFTVFWISSCSNNPVFICLAAVCSLDRVRKQAHFLLDVLAGGLLGFVTSYFLPWTLLQN